MNEGSKHSDSSDDICCLWKLPWLRKFENSPEFWIVMSMADFALDLKEIGLPLTDSILSDLSVMSPSNGKSFLSSV